MRLTLNRLALVTAMTWLPVAGGVNAASAQESGSGSQVEGGARSEETVEQADETEADEGKDPSEATQSLTIGSKAPAIDIEHWLQEGETKFEPVKTFEPGKVYVVEFWATWCPPCVASMPHLAELQKQYKDKDVRIISVSNEDLETVQGFLEKEVPNVEEPTTFAQLTNAYSLTTDPDESVYADYMLAAGQNGIPTAFVVGKAGEVEWIGHPMEMDPVLEEVVAGTWDRTAFATRMAEEKADEAIMMKAAQAFQQGNAEKAASILAERLDEVTSVMSVLNFSGNLLQIAQRSEIAPEVLDKAANKLLIMADDAEERLQPYMFDLRARFLEKKGDLDAAIESEQQAIKRAEGDIKERMISYLEDLRAKKEEGDSEKEAGDESN